MKEGAKRGVNTRIALMLVGLLFFYAAAALAAQDQRVTTVYAVGASQIQGADMSTSRDAAIADGLVSAVTRVLIETLSAKMAVGHFQVLSDTVFAKTDPYVLNYEMLTESISGKHHRVMVKANVSVESLKRSLKKAGIHLSQKQYPQLLYCVAEKSAEALDYQYWWGDQEVWAAGAATDGLQKALSKKGFGRVEPSTTNAQAMPRELTAADAVRLGQQTGAQVVVVAKALAEAAPNTMGATLQSFRGTVAARAYDVRSGRELASSQRTALATADNPSTGSQDSLANASAQVAEDLSLQISRAWFAEVDAASAVEIRVEGISGNVASFVKFRGALSTISGVDSVQRKEMEQDAAVLAVDYQGNVRALADALMRQSFDTFGLNINEPEGNMLRVQLVPR